MDSYPPPSQKNSPPKKNTKEEIERGSKEEKHKHTCWQLHDALVHEPHPWPFRGILDNTCPFVLIA